MAIRRLFGRRLLPRISPQIHLSENQLERIPIHTLSPAQSATPRSTNSRSCPHQNVSGQCAKCRDVQVGEKLQHAATTTVPRNRTTQREKPATSLMRTRSAVGKNGVTSRAGTTCSGDSGYIGSWKARETSGDNTQFVSSFAFAQELLNGDESKLGSSGMVPNGAEVEVVER